MKRLSAILLVLLLSAAVACGQGGKETEAPTATTSAEMTEAPTETPAPEPTKEPADAVLERCGMTADFVGEGKPDPALGGDGNTYVDAAGLGYYVRENGAWSVIASLREAGCKLVRLFDPDGAELAPQIVKTGERAKEPEIDLNGRTLYGWFSDGYAAAWSFDDPVKTDMTLSAIALDTLEKTPTRYTEADRFDFYLRGDEPAGVAVLFLGFTDGLALDKAAFEDRFTGEYGLDECMNSVASYYKYNSYGKAQLEFHFFYCDTGMTSKEGYDYANKQGNRLFCRAIDTFRKEQPDEIRACDKNGDGHIDLTIVVGGEDTEKTVGDGHAYYIYGGSQGNADQTPNTDLPTVNNYLKLPYDRLRLPLEPGGQSNGTRILLHEIGHTFGLIDYYDAAAETAEELIDSLGMFDMQSTDAGDWNPYSKYSVGWLDPYVITPDIDRITLKIGCSSEVPDAILIPTSKGFNGSPFDEYILIDVMAPVGANGYDWSRTMDERLIRADDPKAEGGVRVYHADGRLLDVDGRGTRNEYTAIETAEDLDRYLGREDPKALRYHQFWHRFYNSNCGETYLDDPVWYHQVDLVPSDGSGKFRVTTPLSWAVVTPFCAKDLFGPGDTFSMETCADAFANAPYMNNGGTLEYRVTVVHYDRTAHEAVVTIEKIG